jgi:hypothetical protein
MNREGLLKEIKPCGRKGCIREGLWMPIVVVCTVGQTILEKPVKVMVPMFLCQKHKDEVEVAALLTDLGRRQIEHSVRSKLRREVNWDTLQLEWQSSRGVKGIIH